MCRSDLPRICEIRDCVLNRGCSGTYFDNFDSSIADNAVKRKHFLHVEAELARLDTAAWMFLKGQVLPLFERRHEVRGWQAAFDKLNEAKGYNYLTTLDCTDVAFIPVSSAPGQKTPDLEGKLGAKRVFCEVKTINPSDIEAASRNAVARGQIVSGSTQGTLPDGFFDKLIATLRTAETQMLSYYSDKSARRIVYVVLNFDDLLNEYAEDYFGQIQEFVKTNPLPAIEIIFDAKPKFYSATSESPARRLFICTPDGSWTVQ